MIHRGRAGALAALCAAVFLLAAGCLGGDDAFESPPPVVTAPAAVAAPVVVEPVAPGEAVRAAPDTPKAVARALAGPDVVVIAFTVAGAADDAGVRAALDAVRAERAASAGVSWFSYTVGRDRFGDLADLLGVEGTPSVAVIGRDRALANLWTGLVDADMLRQSISDARDRPAARRPAAPTTPAAVTAS